MIDYPRICVSRRRALAWLAAAGSSLVFNVPRSASSVVGRDIEFEGVIWPQLDLSPIDGEGYGTDPAMNPPQPAPWDRTLTTAQLELVTVLADLTCPGAAAVGVPDVIDEWLSAPYPMQQGHRSLFIPGFSWLDGYCQARFGGRFLSLVPEQWEIVMKMLDTPADQSISGAELPAIFFMAFRTLVSGVYFTSLEGVQVLGYEGNVPIRGDYPGPSKKALAHLAVLLNNLGLTQ